MAINQGFFLDELGRRSSILLGGATWTDGETRRLDWWFVNWHIFL